MISLYGNTIKLKIDSKFYVVDGCVMFCIKIKRIITLYVCIFVSLCYVFCVFAKLVSKILHINQKNLIELFDIPDLHHIAIHHFLFQLPNIVLCVLDD